MIEWTQIKSNMIGLTVYNPIDFVFIFRLM